MQACQNRDGTGNWARQSQEEADGVTPAGFFSGWWSRMLASCELADAGLRSRVLLRRLQLTLEPTQHSFSPQRIGQVALKAFENARTFAAGRQRQNQMRPTMRARRSFNLAHEPNSAAGPEIRQFQSGSSTIINKDGRLIFIDFARVAPATGGAARAVAPIDPQTGRTSAATVSSHLCELRHIALPRIDLLCRFSLDCDPSPMAGPF
jgi:hypothetical protein